MCVLHIQRERDTHTHTCTPQVSWSQLAALRREAAALHKAYREQLLRNEELECTLLAAEHWQRKLHECLTTSEDQREAERDALHMLLRDGLLEAQAQITTKEAALQALEVQLTICKEQ